MPVTKTSEKGLRDSLRKQVMNKPVRSVAKTNITKAEKAIASGNKEEAQKAVVIAVSTLDKAAEKNILHANNAARRKSRLMKKLNQMSKPAA